MTISIIGRKAGMTRVFTDAGEAIPVTVIECTPNRVTQVKTLDTDGYNAVQVAVGEQKVSRLTKAVAGHYSKAGVEAGRGLWEVRLDESEIQGYQAGAEIKVDAFAEVKRVDVTGTSIGKGYAGVVKRYGFGGGRATHGNSLSHRAPGSIGQRQTPGKVWKNKKMAGQMGNKRVTTLNLDLVKVDLERNLLLVKGAVPGAENGNVIVRPTVKG
ncbi:50S ribosomal protein L3 [Flagellatimonas centrodinii]|uniref:50S ribosomal protein L3 n=1 Tax=Flagellatimonas centrodinii TaxID=2806210 RepID=UPI001FEEFA5D|nr:50S ribosomal protein L3 [Flagellatimonas centrodinii]ULQ47340.1 50S ribosomal protein L3 [Flagellatimonas centrodinii]